MRLRRIPLHFSGNRLVVGHRKDNKQVSSELNLSQGLPHSFGDIYTLSLLHQRLNSSRLLNTYLTKSCSAFSLTLNTIAFDHSILRWFAISTGEWLVLTRRESQPLYVATWDPVSLTGTIKIWCNAWFAWRYPIFYRTRRGTIINTASISGLTGGRGGSTYTAPKHAVVGMTMATRETALLPKEKEGTTPDIANIAIFLASNVSAYISRTTIAADAVGVLINR